MTQHTATKTGPLRGKARGLILRAAISLGMAALFLGLLINRIEGLDLAAIRSALASVTLAQAAAAALATAVSFWAAGRYDETVHRHFGTGFAGPAARRAGFAAIAVSQTLGLGVITGAILRWRMLPGISLWLATRLTVAVTLSFLAGWAVVTAAVVLALPDAPFKPWAGAVLAAALAGAALSLAAPRLGGWPGRWPNLFTLSRLLLLTVLDTLAAALALFFLMPEFLPLVLLLPAFLLAFGAGLVSGAPGGIGAFELTFLGLLPTEPEAPLLAAVLVWRAVYYALPALIGAALALRGPKGRGTTPPAPPRVTLRHSFAEAQLLRQGELHLLPVPGGALLAGRTPHLLTALRDAIGPVAPVAAMAALRARARAENRLPVLYKCAGRMALTARRAGFRVMPVAREAWLDPCGFTLAEPARAGLRRKLRRAAAAGVEARRADHLPMAALSRIADDWRRAHGGERGFSMGRFAPDYLAGQEVIIAWHEGRPVGFASFHASAQEWALDLLRPAPDAPDGTAQALIHAAVLAAGRHGILRLSLAAVPVQGLGGRAGRLLARLGGGTRAGAGLAQFKASFAPRWQTLYIAAPNLAALALAALELLRAIQRPGPLPRPSEHDHEDYEFASVPVPWQRMA